MTTTQTTALRFTIIESRLGVHTGTIYRETLTSAERRARADISKGYADSAAIYDSNGQQVATLGSGR